MTNKSTLSDRSEICAHIQILAGLRLPVTIKAQGGFELADCRLLYQPSCGENLFIQLPSRQCPDKGAIEVSYTLNGAPYQFTCTISAKAGSQNNLEVLIGQLPKAIQLINRRLYIRTKYPLNDPLSFDITISPGNTIRVLAEDISAGGIGFFVPKDLNPFAVGDKYPIQLKLPECEKILTQIDIRNLRRFIGMQRIGSRFVTLGVKHRMKIIEHVVRCQTRENPCGDASGAQEKMRVLVHDQDGQPLLWPFLENSYDVRRVNVKAYALGPGNGQHELVILDLDGEGAVETLKTISRCDHLRSLPLILSSARDVSLPFNSPQFCLVRCPVPPEELTATIDRLIYEYRWSQKVCRLDAG